MAILLLTLLLAPTLGAGSVAVAENLDGKVRSVRDISIHLDMPPLATIPQIRNAADMWRAFLRFMSTITAVILWAGMIAYLVMTPAG